MYAGELDGTVERLVVEYEEMGSRSSICSSLGSLRPKRRIIWSCTDTEDLLSE